MGLTGDRKLITEFYTANLSQSDCCIWTLLDFRVWRILYSKLETDKSDLSLCNQAVQNSEINILS